MLHIKTKKTYSNYLRALGLSSRCGKEKRERERVVRWKGIGIRDTESDKSGHGFCPLNIGLDDVQPTGKFHPFLSGGSDRAFQACRAYLIQAPNQIFRELDFDIDLTRFHRPYVNIDNIPRHHFSISKDSQTPNPGAQKKYIFKLRFWVSKCHTVELNQLTTEGRLSITELPSV